MTLKLDFTDTTEIHDLYATYTGKLAFDIGANGGQVANIFAEHFEQVIAVEPAQEPWSYLIQHAAPNVRCLNVAASHYDGTITLYEREMTAQTGYLFVQPDPLPEWGTVTAEHVVPSISVKTLAETYGPPDLVKIDVEGSELDVFYGARRCLIMDRPQFLIEIHSEGAGAKIQSELDMLGRPYRLVRHEQHETGSHRWHNHYWLVSI